MSKTLKNKYYKISYIVLAYALIGSMFALNNNVGAETLKPDPFFLELEDHYRGETKHKQLPFELDDPYKRPKNGPTLKNITHKANKEWIKKWISNPPEMVPNARMPRLMLSDGEIEAVIAYLESIADKDFPKQKWDAYLSKFEDDMDDDEYEKMDELVSGGKIVWGKARCNLCHPVKGKGGSVGVGPDLGMVAEKVDRDWLYAWIKEPKSYFHNTQMARYRFNDAELRKLVEFLLRDWDFKPEEDEDEDEEEDEEGASEVEEEEEEVVVVQEAAVVEEAEKPAESSIIPEGTLAEKGKRIIELSRCFICHDIEGVSDLLPVPERLAQETDGFEKLLNDIRCMTCHNIQGKGGTFAPELTHEASKLKETWIKKFLQTPDIIRPLLKQMPRFKISEEEAESAVKFIEEFFVTVNIPVEKYAGIESTEEGIAKGKELYDSKGCKTCHTISTGGIVGPNLKRVSDRLENGFIFHHLKDPHSEIPDAIEPNYNLTDEEALSLTHYLMSCKSK